MISVYQLKSKFSDILRPLCNSMVKIGITANMVTTSAFILSIAVGAVLYYCIPISKYFYWVVPVSLFIRMALNNIDGVIAREHNQKSNIGAIYNELGDILSDTVIYVPLLYVCDCNFWLIFLFTVLTIISETVGIMGVQINASRHYDGPMGKSDRAFWFSILAMVLAFISIPDKYLTIFVSLVCFLLVYTILNRIIGALKEANNKLIKKGQATTTPDLFPPFNTIPFLPVRFSICKFHHAKHPDLYTHYPLFYKLRLK